MQAPESGGHMYAHETGTRGWGLPLHIKTEFLVVTFTINVRFFSLLLSLRIKKTVIYRRPCPAFYFCEQQCVTHKSTAQGRGPKAEECPISLQLEERGSRSSSSSPDQTAIWGLRGVRALCLLRARGSRRFPPPLLPLWGWAGRQL